jgi:hypothetical protein
MSLIGINLSSSIDYGNWGGAFSGSGIYQLGIEPDSRNFLVPDNFLTDIGRTPVIQYFERESHMIIPSHVEILCVNSFRFKCSIRAVRFSPGAKLRSIEGHTFDFCIFLNSVSVPASVEFMGNSCFAFCPVHFLHLNQDRSCNKLAMRYLGSVVY